MVRRDHNQSESDQIFTKKTLERQVSTFGQRSIPLDIFKMADGKEGGNSKNIKKDVYIPQSAQDVQRMKIEKLMSNPVSEFLVKIRHLDGAQAYIQQDKIECKW